MKVLLVNPPELRPIQANLPGVVERLRGATPPIGLMYAASAARARGDHRIALLDAHALGMDQAAIESYVRDFAPDVTGVTATTFTLLDAIDTAKAVRRAAPHGIILAGGLQPYLYPEETAHLGVFDYGLQGEADATFPDFLDAVFEQKSVDSIPGILYAANGRTVSAPPPEPIRDLDALPFPAHDLLPIARYSSLVTSLRPVAIMISSRGCPFRCAFCSHSVTGKKYRSRSARGVAEEMAYCQSLGFRYILFYDEVMAVQAPRMRELCEAIRGKGVKIPWMARVRAGQVNREMLEDMKGAGCDLITMGIESGSPRVLARLNRPTDVAASVETFRQARSAGLRTIAYFMIGNPDEEDEDLESSLKAALAAGPDMVHAAMFMPYPATDLYEEGVRSGRFASDYWREFSAKPSPDFRPRLWVAPGEEAATMERLRRFYRKYYLRPGFFLGRVRGIRGWSDLKKNAGGLIALLSRRSWAFDE